MSMCFLSVLDTLYDHPVEGFPLGTLGTSLSEPIAGLSPPGDTLPRLQGRQ